MAEDEDLLDLAGFSKEGQPVPNLFFGGIFPYFQSFLLGSSFHLSIRLERSPGVISHKGPPSVSLPELGLISPSNSKSVRAPLAHVAAGALGSCISLNY